MAKSWEPRGVLRTGLNRESLARGLGRAARDSGRLSTHFGSPSRDIGSPSTHFGSPARDIGSPSRHSGRPSTHSDVPARDSTRPSTHFGVCRSMGGGLRKIALGKIFIGFWHLLCKCCLNANDRFERIEFQAGRCFTKGGLGRNDGGHAGWAADGDSDADFPGILGGGFAGDRVFQGSACRAKLACFSCRGGC